MYDYQSHQQQALNSVISSAQFNEANSAKLSPLSQRLERMVGRASGIGNSLGSLRDYLLGSQPEPGSAEQESDRPPTFQEQFSALEQALERIDSISTSLTNAF
jgi:hypothetical protein